MAPPSSNCPTSSTLPAANNPSSFFSAASLRRRFSESRPPRRQARPLVGPRGFRDQQGSSLRRNLGRRRAGSEGAAREAEGEPGGDSGPYEAGALDACLRGLSHAKMVEHPAWGRQAWGACAEKSIGDGEICRYANIRELSAR